MTLLGQSEFVAICPGCEQHRDMDAMPQPGDFWPRCDDCWEPLNFYQRSFKAMRQVDGEKSMNVSPVVFHSNRR